MADRPGRRQLHQKQPAENRREAEVQSKRPKEATRGPELVQHWQDFLPQQAALGKGKGSAPILAFSTIRVQLNDSGSFKVKSTKFTDYVWEAMWSIKI